MKLRPGIPFIKRQKYTLFNHNIKGRHTSNNVFIVVGLIRMGGPLRKKVSENIILSNLTLAE